MKVLYKTSSQKKFFVSEIECPHADEIFLSLDEEVDEVKDFLCITSSQKPKSLIVQDSYRLMRKKLSLTHDELLKSVPQDNLKRGLANASEDLEAALEGDEDKEYLLTYLTIKRFLRSLSRPLVCKDRLRQIASSEEHDAVARRILELCPLKDGFAPRSVYNVAGSSTGRLTITRGPNILTTKAIARSALKSRYKNGRVLQVDLSAAEPNIALNALGLPLVDDVYSHISDKVLSGKVTRNDAKLITLCALYGQSPKNLQKILPDDVRPDYVIKKTREFFGARDLERMLNNSHIKRNLRNVMGRPIKLNDADRRLLVSYYLQSSAAELSIVLFSELCKSLAHRMVPVYVIHDALIIDWDQDLSREFLDKKIINLRMGTWSFNAKVTLIS